MTMKRKTTPPDVPTIETEVPGAVVYLPRHSRMIVFGDDEDAEAWDRWWQELGRIDYMGTVTRKREWAAKRKASR